MVCPTITDTSDLSRTCLLFVFSQAPEIVGVVEPVGGEYEGQVERKEAEAEDAEKAMSRGRVGDTRACVYDYSDI